MTSRAELDELRKLAEKATPGPWVVQQPGDNDPGAGTTYIDTHAYEDGPYPVVAPSYAIAEADAAFIAAANPATILRLLDLIQETSDDE